MSAGGGELERAPRPLLPADVGQVGRRRRAVAVRRQRRLGLELTLAAKVRNRLGEMAERDGVDTGERGLPRRIGGAEEPLGAQPPRALGDGEDAADPTEAAVERELPDRGGALERAAAAPASTPRGAASAIGRSKPEPSLRSSAGARLTVMRPSGNFSSAAEIPLRTRSRASWQARSASPTIAKPGMPSRTCASTSTRRGSRPTSAWVTARASTRRD